jgi:FkbM family methyltransferase
VLRLLLGAVNRVPIGVRSIRCDGDRLYADSVDRWLAAVAWSRGWVAGRERALLQRTLRPGMVAVDVGSNIGFHTLLMARCVGPSGRVHALEPEPRNFGLLARAVEGAGYQHVRLHQVAAADAVGRGPLYVAGAHRGDHRLMPASEPRPRVMVATVTLDALLAGEDRVDLVKIDVQGAEVAVLAGLERTLERHRDLRILCECSPDLLTRAGADADAFFAALRRGGFGAHRLAHDGAAVPVSEDAAWRAALDAGYEMIYFARAGVA